MAGIQPFLRLRFKCAPAPDVDCICAQPPPGNDPVPALRATVNVVAMRDGVSGADGHEQIALRVPLQGGPPSDIPLDSLAHLLHGHANAPGMFTQEEGHLVVYYAVHRA